MRKSTRLPRSGNRKPACLRFESLEERRLLTAATDVSLHVDLSSGDAMLVFNGSQAIAGYEIGSPSGQLVPGNLQDLASQGHAGWVILSKSTTDISELNPTGSLTSSTAVDLGNIFTVAGVHDLAFSWGDAASNFYTSSVVYVTAPGKADTTTTVTTAPATSTYGDSVTYTATVGVVPPDSGAPTGTVTFFDNGTALGSGALTGDTATFTTSTLSAGSHSIMASYGGNSTFNASPDSAAVAWTVNKATLMVTANNAGRTYGAVNPTFTPNYSGFKNSQTLATSGVTGIPSLTTTATAASPVSGSPYTITAAVGTLVAGNYQFAFTNGQLTVDKAMLTVTANNASRAYGDANPTLTPTYNGFKNSETLATSGVTGSPSLTTAATAASPASGSPYTISAAVGTLAAGNYQFSAVNGQLTVSKALVTVTADNASRTYGDANPTFTAGYSGFKNEETLATSGVTGSPSLTTAATAASPVSGSPYAITAAVGTLAAGNYQFAFANGQLTVNKATLTVTANNASRAYGSANPAFTASYGGFKNGQTLATSGVTGSPSLTTTATATSLVAGNPYTITAAAGTLAATNYQFTFANGQLTVTPASQLQNRVFLASDPLSPAKMALYVYGAAGNDVVSIVPGQAPGDVVVVMNGVSRGNFHPTGRIIVHGLAGHDYLAVANRVTLPAWLYGEDGNDSLWGGGGPNILFGGGGNDALRGGSGRGMLIGGEGSDVLGGGINNSLLIGGTTAYDANDAALQAIVNEWNTAATSARASHLTGAAGGVNGPYFLNARTVHDDYSPDTLIANPATDLFFRGLGDTLTYRRSYVPLR